MTFPDLQATTVVELAFGADITADQSTWVWTNVTAAFDVLAQPIQINRGRQDEQSQVEPAGCAVILDNRHGHYTPDQPMSIHYPHVVTGTPIRVTAAGSVRFVGQVASWEPTWPHGDLSDLDDLTELLDEDNQLRGESYVTIRAAGILQRLQQGASPLRSALFRATMAQPMLLAYWPMEDDTSTTVAASPIPGVSPAVLRGQGSEIEAGVDAVAPGSGTSMRLTAGVTTAGAIRYAPPSSIANGWCIESCLRIEPDTSNGVVWQCNVRDSGGNTWRLEATLASTTLTITLAYQPDPEDSGSAVTLDTAVVPRGTYHQVRVLARRAGSSRVWAWDVDGVAQGGATASGGTNPTSVGNVQYADLLANQIIVGHAGIYAVQGIGPPSTWPAVQGWSGETAIGRFDRLCLEEGIAHRIAGQPAVILDTFTRTVSNGWGTADSGQAWVTHGTASGFAVGSGIGSITAPSSTTRAASVDVDLADVDIRLLAELAPGGVALGVEARLTLPGGSFAARSGYAFLFGEFFELEVYRLDGGVATLLGGTFVAVSGQFHLRVQCVGRNLRAKAWPLGEAEPALWDIDIADVAHTSGRVALFSAEATAEFDDLTVLSVPSARLGVQQVATLLDNLQAAADADGGVLFETRDELGLSYRPLASLYNQATALDLDAAGGGHGDITNPFVPVLDDSAARNDVTVSRQDGSSTRVVDTADIARRGLRDEAVTLNLQTDQQTAGQAWWRLAIGTWPGMRYPTVVPALNVRPGLIEDWLSVDLLDRVDVANLPPQHPTAPVRLLMQGYAETITPIAWDAEVNCSPYGPFDIATVGADDGSVDVRGQKIGVEDGRSVLLSAVNSSAAELSVVTDLGPPNWPLRSPWTTDPDEWQTGVGQRGPLDITVGGEIMRVSNIGPSVLDTFTRTVASGWGGSNPTWTIGAGTTSQFSTNGTRALMTISDAVNVLLLIRTDMPSSTDVDLIADVRCEATPAGGTLNQSIIGRWVSNTDHYHAQAVYNVGGVIGLQVRRAGTTLATLTDTGLAFGTSTVYRLRFRVAGSMMLAKMWLASGTEPGWMLSVTDTVVTAAGTVGARAFRGTGNTNTNPPMSWDNFTVNNPQTFTVTRSQNQVIKAHGAGTAVNVAYPARPGLGGY